jgi:hypothetical protein
MNKPASLCKALLCTMLFAACLEPLPDDVPGGGETGGGGGGGGGGSGSGSGSGSGTDPTTSAKFDAWMKCMTLSDFQTSNFYGVWTAMQAQPGNVLCQACHENGGDGFMVTSTQKFFDTLKTNKYYARMYFMPSATEPFSVDANKAVMDGVAYGMKPHAEHPRFIPDPGINASRVLIQMTTQRYQAGGCP